MKKFKVKMSRHQLELLNNMIGAAVDSILPSTYESMQTLANLLNVSQTMAVKLAVRTTPEIKVSFAAPEAIALLLFCEGVVKTQPIDSYTGITCHNLRNELLQHYPLNRPL